MREPLVVPYRAQGHPDLVHADGRPYMSAHDGEPATERIRKRMYEVRQRLAESRPCVSCPAAMMLGESVVDGVTVRCGVERSLITERENPHSLAELCLVDASAPGGGYTRCPSWRKEKERIWAGEGELVREHEGV